MKHLKGVFDGGLNGTNHLIAGETVSDDAGQDILTGGISSDWFFNGTFPGSELRITDYVAEKDILDIAATIQRWEIFRS